MDAASKRLSVIFDSITAEHDVDAKDDIMPSFVFNRSSRSLFGSFIGGSSRRRRRPLSQPITALEENEVDSASLSKYGFDIALLKPQSDLPPPISDLLYFLKNERKCLRSNGDIFEVRTDSISVKSAAIVKAYNEGRIFKVDNIGVDKRDNIAAAFRAVVEYLKAMPRPLIPFAFMNFVLSRDWYRLGVDSPDEVTALRDDFVERLPYINYRILRKLVSTLHQMAIWAFDKQNEEAPVWLVSTFRRHWTFYSIDKPTNNAIFVASFMSLHVFRSGLGRFSPDNEDSLFHFRASCFMAQLMINYESLFEPKRKRVSPPSAVLANSSDKCNRNEVSYENEQADVRFQQVNALLSHLGRIVELSNQMTSICKDCPNDTVPFSSIRKRADSVAIKLDAMGIDVLKNCDSVEKSTEQLAVSIDKHGLFTKEISLRNLQGHLFNIRLDMSDYKTATMQLNLRDYLTFLVAIEGVACQLVSRRFVETTKLLGNVVANSSIDLEEDPEVTSESTDVVFEPAAPVLRHNNYSPAFSRSSNVDGVKTNPAIPDGDGSVRKTPSPPFESGEKIAAELENDIRKNDVSSDDPILDMASSGSVTPNRTPTPTKSPEYVKSPTHRVLDEEKLDMMLKDSSRPQSVASTVSTTSSRLHIPGFHLGALYQGQGSPMVSPSKALLSPQHRYSMTLTSPARPVSRTSNGSVASSTLSRPLSSTPRRYMYMPSGSVDMNRSNSMQRKFQPSLETTI